MEYEQGHEPDESPDLQASIAERVGFHSGDAAESALAQTQAMLAGRSRRPSAAIESQQAPTEPVHATAVAVALAESPAETKSETVVDDGTINTEVSGSGYSTSGSSSEGDTSTGTQVSATTDMGEAAHVGDTGVVSAASPDNLDVDDADDDEEVATIRRARAQQEEIEASQANSDVLEEVDVDEQEGRDEAVQVEQSSVEPHDGAPAAVPQRVVITRGEPDTEATYVRQGMHFDDSGVIHARDFPKSLANALRDDLARMTNVEFAGALSFSGLLAAFVAVQLGVTDETGIDDNTVTAMRAFRKSDHRTGVLEDGLAKLSEQAAQVDQRLETVGSILRKSAEKSRLVENALAYLVTERLDPSVSGSTPPAERPITGGKYRETKDRLRRETDKELKEEKYQSGRPIR